MRRASLAVASFEELYRGFFSIAGLPPRVLVADGGGTTAFTLTLHDVQVTVMHAASTPDIAFVLVEYGAVPASNSRASWDMLMDANLQMLGRHTPIFGRNPLNGEVVLRLGCPLDGTTPVDLYQRLISMVSAARAWREHSSLGDQQAGHPPNTPGLHPGMFA